jgi:fatty acyl-CoA reductase
MVRAKKGFTPLQRLQEIFSSELFNTLFNQQPALKEGWKKKVIPITGDLTLSGLGISEEEKFLLVNEVDIVINCAASVNFDDPLLEALNINYFGCLRILDLALSCKNIVCMAHVSTAYVNSNREEGIVEEKIYEEV